MNREVFDMRVVSGQVELGLMLENPAPDFHSPLMMNCNEQATCTISLETTEAAGNNGSWEYRFWSQILAPPFTSYVVILGKLLYLSIPHFPQFNNQQPVS